MIAIVDYGAGNLSSVKKALEHLGAEAQVTARFGNMRCHGVVPTTCPTAANAAPSPVASVPTCVDVLVAEFL